jgi:hypothetical protein
VDSVVWRQRRRSAVASGQDISTGLRTTLLGPLADSDRQQPMTYTDTTHRRIDARATQTVHMTVKLDSELRVRSKFVSHVVSGDDSEANSFLESSTTGAADPSDVGAASPPGEVRHE